MRKTKIVCTLGPSCETKEMISKMYDAGMNVARINFSHGTHEEHLKKINIIKELREERHIPLPIMLDTKGPEFRTGKYKNGSIVLKEGDKFIFTIDDIVGDETIVSVSYKEMCEVLKPHDRILLNNGLMVFEVDKVDNHNVYTTVVEGGETGNNKSMFFPDKELKLTFLSEQDKSDLLFGIENNVDFIALSFTSNAENILEVKQFLKEHGGEKIDVIAKIENRAGVNHLTEIVEASNGVMVARGDLGVEVPFEEVPLIQKQIIDECRIHGKRCITATEMLESMIHQPRPTRAEISDVANAVYDGSSAIMLSGETAAGKYPIEAIKAMSKIAFQAEQNKHYIHKIPEDKFMVKTVGESLSRTACMLAHYADAKAIVVCTRSGMTARMISRFRPDIDIVGITIDHKAYQQLALSWGVIPLMAEDEYTSIDTLFYFSKKSVLANKIAKKGDTIVITGGNPNGKSGNSSLLNIDVL